MLYIFTGNGKGKTTAAVGQAMRAVGDGKRVLMVQFIKGPWRSGEDESSRRLAPEFLLVKKGRGFVGIMGDTLPREEHEAAAREALAYAAHEAASGTWNIVILDEVNNAASLGLVSKEAVLAFVDGASGTVEDIILTGRDAPPEFIDRADLVTEMREVKHPFERGVKGRRGIEY